ncbi:MAG: hypothetical protein IKL17_03345 [Alistipes sp.]|nr:hypothetical protein [Alistipes sp.]
MKKNFINTVAMVAVAAIATLTSCVSSLYYHERFTFAKNRTNPIRRISWK